ncbi:hypothetical protein EB001_21240 [bacterium]|nr:hypothetical protein [bacterium]
MSYSVSSSCLSTFTSLTPNNQLLTITSLIPTMITWLNTPSNQALSTNIFNGGSSKWNTYISSTGIIGITYPTLKIAILGKITVDLSTWGNTQTYATFAARCVDYINCLNIMKSTFTSLIE